MKKGIFLLGVLCVSTSVYASGSHTGGHGQHAEKVAKHWQAPENAMHQKNPVPASEESISSGKKSYAELCVGCHGGSLRGDGPGGRHLKTAPTNLREMSGGHSDGDFAWKIRTGKGDMPAWEDELDKKEIWNVVNYIQSFKKDVHSQGHDEHKQ